MDKGASEFRAGLELVLHPVVPVQSGGGSEVHVAGTGPGYGCRREVGQVVFPDSPGGGVHLEDPVPESGDPDIPLSGREALDVQGLSFRSLESQVFHGSGGQVQQGQAAVFGACEQLALVQEDDRPDHVPGQFAARPAPHEAGHEIPLVPAQGEPVIEHAHPEVSLAVPEHGPDILAGEGFGAGIVVGDDLGALRFHQEDAPVGPEQAHPVLFRDDAADFTGPRAVQLGGGVRIDIGAQDGSAAGGIQEMSRPVRDEVMPGQPAGKAAVTDPFEGAAQAVEAVQVPVGGQEPDGAVAVGLHDIAAEGGGRAVVDEGFPPGIPAEDVFVREPDQTVPVDGDVGGADPAAGQIVPDRARLAGLQVMETDAAGGDEPQAVLLVLGQAHRQPVQDFTIGVLQRLEMHAVVHTDAFARAKPDQAEAVLENAADGIVGKAVIGAEIPETEAGVLGSERKHG